jgi:hypothetical protein
VQGRPDPRVEDVIKRSFNVTELVIGESHIILRMPESRKKLADLIKIVSELGAKIGAINIRELTLDDVFLYYTKKRIL